MSYSLVLTAGIFYLVPDESDEKTHTEKIHQLNKENTTAVFGQKSSSISYNHGSVQNSDEISSKSWKSTLLKTAEKSPGKANAMGDATKKKSGRDIIGGSLRFVMPEESKKKAEEKLEGRNSNSTDERKVLETASYSKDTAEDPEDPSKTHGQCVKYVVNVHIVLIIL